jgi:hypothetical protein
MKSGVISPTNDFNRPAGRRAFSILKADFIKHLRNCPNGSGEASFHRGSDAKRLVNPAEVVVHVKESHGINVVFNLLGEAVCQPGESAHSHSH